MSEGHISPTVRPGQVYAGVVIRLPEPLGRELRDWRASFGDTQAGTVPAHITLMISTRGKDWDELVAHVRDVVSGWEPFHVEIDGTGTFRPLTPVVYLRIGRGFEECVRLHRELHGDTMRSASPFDFHPHVTLAHGTTEDDLNRAQAMLRTYRAGFMVDHIDLYEADEHGAWHVRDKVPFGAKAVGHRDGP